MQKFMDLPYERVDSDKGVKEFNELIEAQKNAKSFEEAWEHDYDILDQTCRHHLRHVMDINQWFIRERQLAEGKFHVRMMPKDAIFSIQEDSPLMHQTIRGRRVPMICLHDIGPMDSETFQELKTGLQNDFLSVLPGRSSYER